MKNKKNDKKETKKCIGIDKKGDVCGKCIGISETYCEKHIYFDELTNEQLNDIKNGNAKTCDRCPQWHFENHKLCKPCQDKKSKKQKERKQKISRCKGIMGHGNGNQCIHLPVNGTEYCNSHEYMTEYTEEQIKLLHECSDCGMYKFTGANAICDVCIARAAEIRAKAKSKPEPKIICKGYVNDKPCIFEAKENGYCGKHEVQAWIEEMEKDNSKKVCTGYTRGCRNMLDKTNKFSRCEECRNDDKVIISKKIEESVKITNAIDEHVSFDDSDEFISIDDSGECVSDNVKNNKDIIENKADTSIQPTIKPIKKKRSKEEQKEYDRIRKQKYRTDKREEIGEQEYKIIHNETIKNYRDINKNKIAEETGKKQRSAYEQKEYNRNRKREYRNKLNANKIKKEKPTIEELREKERLRKQKQRASAKQKCAD